VPFLFLVSASRLSLHAFPTRRSSDLSPQVSCRDAMSGVPPLAPNFPPLANHFYSLSYACSSLCFSGMIPCSHSVPAEHPLPRSRSEEHTSELQSRENLVCRRQHGKKN